MNKKFNGYVIYTDMDGTLLNDNKEVTKENIEYISYFVQNGGKFSIATGRAIQSIKKYIEILDVNLPAIVYNGGMVATLDSVIYEKKLEEYKKELIYKIKNDYPSLGIEIYCGNNVYVFNDNNMSIRPATKLLDIHFDIPQDILQYNWNKILLVGDKLLINQLIEELENKYNLSVVRSGDLFLEILPEDVSKGSGLDRIMEIYKLDKNKVIAVGDNMNDYEMLKSCGISFCPSNACEEIKSTATHIISDNNNSIIVDIINEIEKKIK